ncbi:recombinase family protein [Azospirillum sp. BE72]|uniref:recombinase family protein n=1 Tax=Azospirillum sp. BE72 TaxID=2817776 RepID=UPI0028676D1C|nr:recombinase family protein [Azospirillum sp. BE72]MDR6775529.1 DNA invertase Pin-like site-specific DNA recombinase [Azospirillum sp. BE72]
MTAEGPRFIAYYRVSTTKQGADGLGIEAQQSAVAAYAAGKGELVDAFTEVESGKRKDRPELARALEACRKNRAVLVVAKLDRLARNVAFIARLMEAGVEFVAVDFPEANRLTLHILAAVAEHEREMIAQRTRAALAAAKARGVRLGNPALGRDGGAVAERGATARRDQANVRAQELSGHVARIRAAGWTTYAGLAEALNDRGIPTPQGRRWHASSARRLVLRLAGVRPKS